MSKNHGKIAARTSTNVKRFESIMTVKTLKEVYLYGITIEDAEGNPLPDSAYQQYIDNAISMLEHYLDIWITPTAKEEQKEYHANDYFQWGYLQLNENPVISVESLAMSYLRDNTGTDLIDEVIPDEWIRLDKDTGIIRLVPNSKFPSKLQVGAGGSFFPEVFRRHSTVPALWIINYTVGFEDGKVPVLLNQAVGLLAATQALSIAGNLVLGAGIAGSSISLDGLSQSIQTTQSAENSAYSATLKEYANRVFGRTKDDPSAILRVLKDYYKGSSINII